jgi:Lipid A 3-O-deacylase (PagL)
MRKIAVLLLVILKIEAAAQWQVHGQLQRGFIAPHHDLMDPMLQSHSLAASLQCVKQVKAKNYSASYFNPFQGVDLSYIQTGSPNYLGNQFTLSFWNKFPVYKGRKNNSNLTKKYFSLGFGVGYTTKIWDLTNNYQSPVLGSHLNATLSLAFEQQLIETKKRQILIGFRITHLSNGAFQLPNLGTNHLALTVGAQEKHHKKIAEPEIVIDILPKFYIWNFSLSNGWKEVMEPFGPKYPIWIASLGYDFRNKKKHGWGLSLDGIYNSSLKPLMANRDNIEPLFKQIAQLGGGIVFIQYFGNTHLRIEQGAYLRDKWKETTPVYQRIVLRHAPKNKNYFIQIGLKTHFAKADHGEIGIGYRF